MTYYIKGLYGEYINSTYIEMFSYECAYHENKAHLYRIYVLMTDGSKYIIEEELEGPEICQDKIEKIIDFISNALLDCDICFEEGAES